MEPAQAPAGVPAGTRRPSVPTTYGDHAEEAAQALSRLLVLDEIPIDGGSLTRMLDCRQAVVDALRQRLRGVGLNGDPTTSTQDRLAPALRGLEGLGERLGLMIEAIAVELPTLPPDDRGRPVDVLAGAASDPVVEWWRRAAVELLAGSHALDTTDHQPWLTEPGAAWYLMRDLATALETVLILDERLAEVGVLAKHDIPVPSLGLDTKRMLLGHVARVATWSATSDSPDQAFTRLRAEPVAHGPVVVVATPKDLAAAQRRLATFLRPTHASDAFYTSDPEITADTARMLVANQMFLTGSFGQLAERSPGPVELGALFEVRREILEEITPQLRHLVDHRPVEDRARRWWQQTEITTAFRRMRRDHGDFRLAPAELLDLANATHQVTHNLAVTLRRELLRENTNLRIDDPTRAIGATRVVRGTRLDASLTDLAQQPAPTRPVARLSNPYHRTTLRRTLDLTATGSAAPPPYSLRPLGPGPGAPSR